jgi:thioredoxin-related protein
MKILISSLILTVVIAFNAVAQQQSVKWYTIQEALILNKTQPKKFMIDVYTDWCGWCKKMDKETFTNPVIAKYLNENFYPIKFNAETLDTIVFQDKIFVNDRKGNRSSNQFAIALLKGQMSYPSIAYINQDLVLLGSIPGYKTPEELEVWLNFVAQDKFKTMKFDEFQNSFVPQTKVVETPASGGK